LIFLMVAVFALSGCMIFKNSTGKNANQVNIKDNTRLANPAAVFCDKQGGSSKIMTKPDGSQYGICAFADGSQCEEWAYFRGECQPNTTYSEEFNEFSKEKAQQIAQDWVLKNSPTYTFDGFDLKPIATTLAGKLGFYTANFSFKSRQAGYGDRTGQAAAQMITNHIIVIDLIDGQVVGAVTDNQYDEFKKEPYVPEPISE